MSTAGSEVYSSGRKNAANFPIEQVLSTLSPASSTVKSDSWQPLLHYEAAKLGSLVPGPRNLVLKGRVVNFHNIVRPSKSPRTAQGCLRIMLADDSGQLIALWTVHVSKNSEHNNLAPRNAPLFTSIFPEGERNCHLMVLDESDDGTQSKLSTLRGTSQVILNLTALRSYAQEGHDKEEVKLLVCVKHGGRRKAYLDRSGTTREFVSIRIFDDTAEASLTFYGCLCDSALAFHSSKTVLLIWNPRWHISESIKLSLNSNSRIDIDPDIDEAQQLRAFALHLNKKNHVNPQFPETDSIACERALVRALYTLADIDDFLRSNSAERLIGYLSVVLMKLNIVTPFKRNMLMSNECCGIAVFANAQSRECEQCEKPIVLRVNPALLDSVIDETGRLSDGKMILSDQAWEQLLGRTPAQLLHTDLDTLLYLEQRLSFIRVTMGFTITLEYGIGHVAVWCVRI